MRVELRCGSAKAVTPETAEQATVAPAVLRKSRRIMIAPLKTPPKPRSARPGEDQFLSLKASWDANVNLFPWVMARRYTRRDDFAGGYFGLLPQLHQRCALATFILRRLGNRGYVRVSFQEVAHAAA